MATRDGSVSHSEGHDVDIGQDGLTRVDVRIRGPQAASLTQSDGPRTLDSGHIGALDCVHNTKYLFHNTKN